MTPTPTPTPTPSFSTPLPETRPTPTPQITPTPPIPEGGVIKRDPPFRGPLVEPLSPIELSGTEWEEVWYASSISIANLTATKVKFFVWRQRLVKEERLVKTSSEGYKLIHYKYDDQGYRTDVWTEYVHEGEIFQGLITNVYKETLFSVISLPAHSDPEFHPINDPLDD